MRQVIYNPLQDEEYVREALCKANEIAMAFAERDLQTEESLQRVTDEIANIMKQNVLLRNQLITLSNAQVDDAQIAMEKIDRANAELADIKKNFETINSKAKESQTLVKNYSSIRTVQNSLANVSMAREWLARVLRLRKEVTQLKKILKFEREYFEDDKEKSEASEEDSDEESEEDFDASAYDLDEILVYDPDNEDSMLLEIHERIYQLETFRSTVFAESEEHPEFLDTFSTYLSVIDEVSEEFMQIIDKHFEKIVELAEEDPVRIVRIARIIEREQREILESEERIKANPMHISIKKQSRTMKERCFDKIEENISNYFKFNLNDCSDLEARLDRLAELCDGDLEHIERNVVPCFPKEYNIMQRYVQGYEKQIRDFLKKQISSGKLSNTEKVSLITWIHENLELFDDYKQYISEKDFGDILVQLKADYLGDFNTKLQEWSEKVIAHAIKPDTKLQEDDGCVYTYAPTDFFTFLNQTISAVGATKQQELIEKIAFAVRNTLCIFKDQMLRNLLTRMESFSKEKICAHINDCSRCIQFTKELEEGLVEILPKVSEDVFEMDEVVTGFEELAKRILKILASKTVDKLEHYFEEQFGKNWYNKNKVSSIQTAFKELTKEFEGSYLEYLEYDFIGILAESILNKLVKLYLDGWIVKKFSLKDDEIDIVKAEIAAFKKFCGNEPWSFEALKPLEFLKDFLSIIDIEDVTEAIGDALCPKNFPDMPMFIPETIIRKCGKYKKKEQDELIATITKFYEGWKELNKVDKDTKKTIFSLYRMDDKGKKGFFRRGRKKVITGIEEDTKEEGIPPPLVPLSTKQSEDTIVEEVMDLDDFLNADFDSPADVETSGKHQAESEDEKEDDTADTESDNDRQKPARNNKVDISRSRSSSNSSSMSGSDNESESRTRSDADEKSAEESNSDDFHTDESSDSSTESD